MGEQLETNASDNHGKNNYKNQNPNTENKNKNTVCDS